MHNLQMEAILGPCFEGLVTAAKGYDPEYGTRFSTFAYRGMLNALMTFFRKEGRRGPGSVQSLSLHPVCKDPAPRADVRELVEKALRPLSDRERYILVQTCAERRSGGKVGKSLGITHERVRQIRNKALGRCRRALGIHG